MLKNYWRWLLFPLALLLISIFTFDSRTEAFLAQLNPLFGLWLRAAWGIIRLLHGFSPYPTSGRRTAAQQAAQHAANPKNPAPVPGKPNSHERGEAMDCDYMDSTGKIVLLKDSPDAAWAPVVAVYDALGLGWGGRFKGYRDRVHVYKLS